LGGGVLAPTATMPIGKEKALEYPHFIRISDRGLSPAKYYLYVAAFESGAAGDWYLIEHGPAKAIKHSP